jgi:hypothetical protein
LCSRSAEAQIRLRVALHAGEVFTDKHGAAGAALNHAFRLIEAAELRSALASSPGVLALIVSSSFYRDVVRNSPASNPGAYRRVEISVKETAATGWIFLPDHAPPAGEDRTAEWGTDSQEQAATGPGRPAVSRAVRVARALLRRRAFLSFTVAVVLAAAGTAAWLATGSADPASQYHIVVTSGPDKVTTVPEIAATGGSYVTTLPIQRVPPPPGLRDSCAGRYDWAHQPPVSAVDAYVSIAKVDITPLAHSVTITGARLIFDNDQAGPIAGTLLTCGGAGGYTPPHLLSANLDSGKMIFYPYGGATPGTLSIHIPRGGTDSLLISGRTVDHFCRWRLELDLNDGQQTWAVTVGVRDARFGTADQNPAQLPFETTASRASTPYRFRDGRWQTGG